MDLSAALGFGVAVVLVGLPLLLWMRIDDRRGRRPWPDHEAFVKDSLEKGLALYGVGPSMNFDLPIQMAYNIARRRALTASSQ